MKVFGRTGCVLGLSLVFLFASSFTQLSRAQDMGEEIKEASPKEKERDIELDKVVVKGEILPVKKSAFSVYTLDSNEIENLRVTRTLDLIEEFPGIDINDYHQGGTPRAVIARGFDMGSHGGDLGIYIDGIPLNEFYGHGGGQADTNIIIPLEIANINMYKGPSSAMYGNFSRAGTLAFFTKRKGEYNKLIMQHGSFDTCDAQIAMGAKMGENIWNNTAIQHYRTDGFIDDSKYLKGNASTRFTFAPHDKLEVSIALRAHGSEWDSPGYLPFVTQDDFYSREVGRKSNGSDDGGCKEQFSERVDVAYDISKEYKMLFFGYGVQMAKSRWADWGSQSENNYNRSAGGSGLCLNIDTVVASIPITGIAGIEFYRDDTNKKNFTTDHRERLSLNSDDDTVTDTYSVFVEAEIDLYNFFRPTIGGRYDAFVAKYEDINGFTTEFDWDKYDSASPKAGFRSTLAEDTLELRGSVCNGFILPGGTDKYDVSIKPEKIWQYELGLTITPLKRIWVDIAGFAVDTIDEVENISGDSNNPVYKNVGETRRKGIETSMNIKPFKGVEISGDFSWTDSEILKSNDSSREGKAIHSIPKYIANARLKYASSYGPGINANWRYVGKFYVDDGNTETYGDYSTVDLGIFYRLIEDDSSIDVSFEVKNIFDEHYAATAHMGWNIIAIGDPRTYRASVSMKW